jgi:hypothetical protein
MSASASASASVSAPAPTAPTTIAADTSTTAEKKPRAQAYAVSKDGKPYRSFRLVDVADERWKSDGAIPHAATNKSKKEGVHTSHLGPLRAGQKIFDAWCRHNTIQVVAPTRFTIQETTRGKSAKAFVYEGFREKLDTPREIVVTNKANNTKHTIKYAFRSKIRAFREGDAKAVAGAKAEAKVAKVVKEEAKEAKEVVTEQPVTKPKAAAKKAPAKKAPAKKAPAKKTEAPKVSVTPKATVAPTKKPAAKKYAAPKKKPVAKKATPKKKTIVSLN